MDETRLQTISQLSAFLAGTLEVQFNIPDSDDRRYAHIIMVAQRLGYTRLKRADKGVVLRHLQRTSGYSRDQVSRWLGTVVDAQPLDKRYKAPATVHLLKRAFNVYGDARFERLAGLSVSHLYNLRHSKTYLNQRVSFTKTRLVVNPIGVRRAPRPAGRPGFIGIDSVHQGDLDGTKGVYHVNAVDIVTQWDVVAICERISEAYLLPVLKDLMDQFPFEIVGIHSDNGSEYINKTLAALLEKMRIEQTKSRSRHCNDNALAQSKNGSLVRKAFGYSHIPQRFATVINEFCREHLNPY